jgi:hypothetical protein
MLEPTTFNSAGKQIAQIRSTAAEKQCYTIMLAITAGRKKPPPYVVFKCKAMAKEKFPHRITVDQESGWMTEDLIDDWIKCIWFQYPDALLCQQSMLVSYSFWDQTTENMKTQLRQEKKQPGNHTRRHY